VSLQGEIAKLQNTFFYGILRGQAYVYIIEFMVAVAKIGGAVLQLVLVGHVLATVSAVLLVALFFFSFQQPGYWLLSKWLLPAAVLAHTACLWLFCHRLQVCTVHSLLKEQGSYQAYFMGICRY